VAAQYIAAFSDFTQLKNSMASIFTDYITREMDICFLAFSMSDMKICKENNKSSKKGGNV